MMRGKGMVDSDREVCVFIEQEAGEIAPVSLELLSKARELGARLGLSTT